MTGKKREAMVFSYEEIKKGLLSIPDQQDQFMLAASYANGTRVGEVVGIKRSDVTWNEQFVYIETPVLKKRKKEKGMVKRAPPINRREIVGDNGSIPEAWLANIIIGYCEGPEPAGCLVPRQEKTGRLIDYGVRTAQRRFEKYFHCTSHSFRHTRATHCFQYLKFGERLIQEYFRLSPRGLGDWCSRYGHLNRHDLEVALK